MARFKNVSGGPVDLFAVAGEASSFRVAADEIVEVPGAVVGDNDDNVDAYTIGEGDAARLWPKSTWQLTKADAPRETAPRARPQTSTTTDDNTPEG